MIWEYPAENKIKNESKPIEINSLFMIHLHYLLSDFILFPSEGSEYFFKISTESIISFYPYTSKQKLLEHGREYVVVDIGYFFLNKVGAEPFIIEVNPNPDLSLHAGYVRSLKIAEILFEKFIEKILLLSLERRKK